MGVVVQSIGNSGSGVLSLQVTLTGLVAGNSVLILIGREGATDRTFTPTTDKGDSVAQIFNILGTAAREIQQSIIVSAVGGTTVVTVTASGSTTFSIAAYEISTVHATLYDDARGTTNEAGTNSSHTWADSPGVTTSNDIVLFGMSQAGASYSGTSGPSGYTLTSGLLGSSRFGYKLASPGGVSGEQATWTQGGTARQCNSALQAIRFAAAAAAGAARLVEGGPVKHPIFGGLAS